MNAKTKLVLELSTKQVAPAHEKELAALLSAIGSGRIAIENNRDWRDAAKSQLATLLPDRWVYCGGSHVALHAVKPTNADRDAGYCFGRILEWNH